MRTGTKLTRRLFQKFISPMETVFLYPSIRALEDPSITNYPSTWGPSRRPHRYPLSPRISLSPPSFLGAYIDSIRGSPINIDTELDTEGAFIIATKKLPAFLKKLMTALGFSFTDREAFITH